MVFDKPSSSNRSLSLLVSFYNPSLGPIWEFIREWNGMIIKGMKWNDHQDTLKGACMEALSFDGVW